MSRTSNYVYTVYDTKKGCTLLIYTDLESIHNLIGIEKYKVHSYCINKYKYKGRYLFTLKDREKPKKPECPVFVNKPFSHSDLAFMPVYDKAMAGLRQNYSTEFLKNIKIGCVNK